MNKSLLSALVLVSLSAPMIVAQDFEDAYSAVDNMRIGWNLGNSLDSNSGAVDNMWIERWTSRLPADYETAWGQPLTTRQLIHMFKEAGFNAIRVPVTWYPHYGPISTENYKNENNEDKCRWNLDAWTGFEIDPLWMERVHEIVDYVIDEGMYCILNVHHDTGEASTAWLRADRDVYSKQQERFENLWTAIANEFVDYDQHLLFEGFNEMLDSYGSWCFASSNCNGGYNSSISIRAYQSINNYAQSFVNAVRATGGNNAYRNLIVNTYGSCCGEGDWNGHLIDPLNNMKRPADAVERHIIFEVHCYPDITNLSYCKDSVNKMFGKLNQYLVAKGCPVIIGEWGTLVENNFALYEKNLLDFARFFVEKAHENNMATFYWMGLSDGNDRAVPKWTQPDLKEAIVKGYYGDKGYNGIDNISLDKNIEDAPIFNLLGTRVYEPLTPGLYIKNGSKFIIR